MRKTFTKNSLYPVYVVMGVAGTGKTTVAKAVAEKQNYLFLEGDDFHPPENIELMSSGRALTDAKRLPWLKELSSRAVVDRHKGTVLVTCSALKAIYRDEIRKQVPDANFIHLHGSFDYIAKLMTQREDHFMPVSLLQSQFDTLESLQKGEHGTLVSIENGFEAVMSEVGAYINNRTSA